MLSETRNPFCQLFGTSGALIQRPRTAFAVRMPFWSPWVIFSRRAGWSETDPHSVPFGPGGPPRRGILTPRQRIPLLSASPVPGTEQFRHPRIPPPSTSPAPATGLSKGAGGAYPAQVSFSTNVLFYATWRLPAETAGGHWRAAPAVESPNKAGWVPRAARRPDGSTTMGHGRSTRSGLPGRTPYGSFGMRSGIGIERRDLS